MSDKLLPDGISARKEALKAIVLGLGFKLDEELKQAFFVTNPEGLIFGIGVGSKDSYVAINFAMAIDQPVDNEKRLAALNFINLDYKVVKCYYQDISIVLSCEAFVKTEEAFIEFFKYSVSTVLRAYDKLEELHPGAL